MDESLHMNEKIVNRELRIVKGGFGFHYSLFLTHYFLGECLLRFLADVQRDVVPLAEFL